MWQGGDRSFRRGRHRSFDEAEGDEEETRYGRERLLRWQRWLTGIPVVSFAFTRELERRKGCAADTRKEGDSCSRVSRRVFVCKSIASLSLSLSVSCPSPRRSFFFRSRADSLLFHDRTWRAERLSRFSFLIPFVFVPRSPFHRCSFSAVFAWYCHCRCRCRRQDTGTVTVPRVKRGKETGEGEMEGRYSLHVGAGGNPK